MFSQTNTKSPWCLVFSLPQIWLSIGSWSSQLTTAGLEVGSLLLNLGGESFVFVFFWRKARKAGALVFLVFAFPVNGKWEGLWFPGVFCSYFPVGDRIGTLFEESSSGFSEVVDSWPIKWASCCSLSIHPWLSCRATNLLGAEMLWPPPLWLIPHPQPTERAKVETRFHLGEVDQNRPT